MEVGSKGQKEGQREKSASVRPDAFGFFRIHGDRILHPSEVFESNRSP